MATTIGKLAVILSTDTRAFVSGLTKAQKRIKKFRANLAAVGKQMMTVGTAVLAPMGLAIKQFVSLGDELSKLSKRTGFSVESLSLYRQALELSDASMQDFAKAVRMMNNVMLDAERGLSTARYVLEDLGISLQQLQGLRPEERFLLVVDALSKVEDMGRRSALAMDIFGRSGTQLLPFLEQGAESIKNLLAHLKRMGYEIGTTDAEAAVKLKDTMTELWWGIKRVAFEIGASLAPKTQDLVAHIRLTIVRTLLWIKNNRKLIAQKLVLIAKIASWTVGLGAAAIAVNVLLGAVGKLIGAVKVLIGVFTTLKTVSVALAATGFGAIVLGIGTVAAAVNGLKPRLTHQQQLLRGTSNDAYEAAKAMKAFTATITELNEVQRQMMILQLEEVVAETKKNIETMQEELEKLSNIPRRLGAEWFGGYWGSLQEMNDRTKELLKQREILAETEKRLERLREIAAAPPVPELEAIADVAKEEQQWLDRIQRQRIDMIEDEFARRRTLLQYEWAKQRQELAEMKAPERLKALVDTYFREGLEAITREQQKAMQEIQETQQSFLRDFGVTPAGAIEWGTPQAYSAQLAPYWRAMELATKEQLRRTAEIERHAASAATSLRKIEAQSAPLAPVRVG